VHKGSAVPGGAVVAPDHSPISPKPRACPVTWLFVGIGGS